MRKGIDRERIKRELVLSLSFFKFIRGPSLEALDEPLSRQQRFILKGSFLAVHLAILGVAYVSLMNGLSEEVLSSKPASGWRVFIVIALSGLGLIMLGNLVWAFLMRTFKLASEKSIVRVIRYFR